MTSPVWSLPVVSSSVVELEQEAAQVRGRSPACACPGVCVWAGRWSRSLAACCCIADWRSEVAGRTWLLTECCTMNRTAGTDGLKTGRQADRQVERQTGRETDSWRGRQTVEETDRQVESKTAGETDRCDVSEAELGFDWQLFKETVQQFIYSLIRSVHLNRYWIHSASLA